MFVLRGSAATYWHRAFPRPRDSIHLRNELFLQALHLRSARTRLVIVASQVKEAVRDVETELVLERGSERARLAPRRFRANHDFAMLKRDDVGGACFIEKASMKFSHPPVGNQNDAHFV